MGHLYSLYYTIRDRKGFPFPIEIRKSTPKYLDIENQPHHTKTLADCGTVGLERPAL